MPDLRSLLASLGFEQQNLMMGVLGIRKISYIVALLEAEISAMTSWSLFSRICLSTLLATIVHFARVSGDVMFGVLVGILVSCIVRHYSEKQDEIQGSSQRL